MTGTRGSRLTIIGGGVMGLMTAYYAAPLASSVTVLDKSRVGDPGTASFGLTRSVRNDYLDPQYSRLAYEARQLWLEVFMDSLMPMVRRLERRTMQLANLQQDVLQDSWSACKVCASFTIGLTPIYIYFCL